MSSAADVVAIGRVGVDFYSLDFYAPLKDARTFAKYVGGGAANISVGLSRLGLKVCLVSKVSDDELGEFVIDFLSKEGIDTRWVGKTSKGKIGLVFAETVPGTDSKFIFYRENVADLMIEKEDLSEDAIRRTKLVIATGTGLSANPSRETNYHAMEVAKKYGKKNLLNLDWRPSLWRGEESERRVQIYKKAVEMSDVIVGNETEYRAATGAPSAEEAVARLSESERILLLTRGEDGSRVYEGKDKKPVDVEPFRVDMMKSLGAGDGIIAGFVYGYLGGWESYKAARFGNAVGAIVVSRHSCSEAMPTFEETIDFIEKNGGWKS